MRMKHLCGAALAASIAPAGWAQLVVGNDQTSATIWYIDLATNNATPLLSGTQARSWGMAYASGSNTLYWNDGGSLYSSAFSTSGLTPGAPVPLTFNGATTNFVGLAWHQGRLLGTRNVATEGVYEIDPATGVASLLWAYSTGFDFGGLDSDGTTLYGLSDTAPAGAVRGLFSIDAGAQTTSFITGYPTADTDIDGLAVGGGRAYFVNDSINQSIFVYNFASGQFETPITNPITGSGIFSAGAFVPAPGAAAVFGLAGLAGLRRRR